MTRFLPTRAMLAALALWGSTATAVLAQKKTDVDAPEPKTMNAEATTAAKGSALPSAIQVHEKSPNRVRSFLLDFAEDQGTIWTSPSRLRFRDASWLVPMGGLTAGLFVTDSDVSRHLSHDPSTLSHYNTLSNAAVAGLVGGAGTMWAFSHFNGNEHWRETGFLAGQAAVHSLIMTEAFKYSLRRSRPYQGDGTGPFFQPGGTSFPSEHAAAAWSVAGIVAHEYPGPLTKILAYGAATLVSYSRVRAEKHFPSDVAVGAMLGQLAAYHIYKRHHDPELGGAEWRSIGEIIRGSGELSPANEGSPYVPLDSWVYSAFDRLIALGYIRSAIVGLRPWTRLECMRLLVEAGEQFNEGGSDDLETRGLYDALVREFSFEFELAEGKDNRTLQVESLYARGTGIAGEPLTDGFHFGQTVMNDFGRPYSEGFSSIGGFSGWMSEGRLTAYLRGEYQYAPSIPALSEQARQYIATSFGTLPVPPAVSTAAVNRFRLLDAYVATNFENWQISFGRQSLSWGPSVGGAMLFSNNATPVTMFRIDRVTPFKLPWLFGLMGPIRWQFIFGRLSGQEFVRGDATGLIGEWGQDLSDQPFILGQKLNFKPTPNFEFGVGYTRLSGGNGQPFTPHQFLISLFSLGNGTPGSRSDPGDIRSGVNFTYKLPGLRNWLTFYGEAFDEDEFSPLGYPRKSAYQGGIYLPRLPGIPKLDLRLEGGSTEPPDFGTCVGCFYSNTRFLSGYTNGGNLMGTWLGRAGQGEQVWSTYWLSPRNKIQFNYRHQKAVANFVPGGGTVNDFGVKAEIWIGARTMLTSSMQYERWNFPILADGPQANVASSVGITFFPRTWKR